MSTPTGPTGPTGPTQSHGTNGPANPKFVTFIDKKLILIKAYIEHDIYDTGYKFLHTVILKIIQDESYSISHRKTGLYSGKPLDIINDIHNRMSDDTIDSMICDVLNQFVDDSGNINTDMIKENFVNINKQLSMCAFKSFIENMGYINKIQYDDAKQIIDNCFLVNPIHNQ